MTKYITLVSLALMACSSADTTPNLGNYVPPDGGDAGAALRPPSHLSCVECQPFNGPCICLSPGSVQGCQGQPAQNSFALTASVPAGQPGDFDLQVTDQLTTCGNGYICLATKEATAGAHYVNPQTTADHHWHFYIGSQSASGLTATVTCWPVLSHFVNTSYRIDQKLVTDGQTASAVLPVDEARSVTFTAGWSGDLVPGSAYVGVNDVPNQGVTSPQIVAHSDPGRGTVSGKWLTILNPTIGTVRSIGVTSGTAVTLGSNVTTLSYCGMLYNEGPSSAQLGISWVGSNIYLGSANELPSIASARCVY